MKIFPVILAGGAGTRLWPLSQDVKPKQFQNLSGEGTLLLETIKRLLPLKPDTYLIITSKRHEELTIHELKKIDVNATILAEPYPRNTAAAILYGALYLKKINNQSLMIVLPADHYIKDNILFVKALQKAIDQAKTGKLVTIGLKPTYPETGYGYIKASGESSVALDVERFVEKPNTRTAKKYILDGNYYWNSGIYVWKTETILEYFKKLMPHHYNTFEPLGNLEPDEFISSRDEVWQLKEDIFSRIDSISIDYGIMEKADNRVVIPSDFGWADLGSWKSIDDILPHDENMNRTPQKDNVLFVDSKNCSVFPENKRITILGLSNIVVVESGSELLVMDKSAAQEVRRVVDIINNDKSSH
jgi:mannose-1-phosphate guanylyltransferase